MSSESIDLEDDLFFMRNPLALKPKLTRKKSIVNRTGGGKEASTSSKTINLNSDSDSNSSDSNTRKRRKTARSSSSSDLEVLPGEKKKSTRRNSEVGGKGKKVIGAPRSIQRLIPSDEVVLDSDEEDEEEDELPDLNIRRKKQNESESPESLPPGKMISLTQLDRSGDALSRMATDWKGPERIPLASLKPIPKSPPLPPRLSPLKPNKKKTSSTSPSTSKPKATKAKSRPVPKAAPMSPPSPPAPKSPTPPPEIQPPTPISFWEAGETKTVESKKKKSRGIAGEGLKALASLSRLRDSVIGTGSGSGKGGSEVEEIDSTSEEEEEGGGKKYESVADAAKRKKAEGIAKLKASREAKSNSVAGPSTIKKATPPLVANPFVASKIAAAKVKEGTSPCGICSKSFPDSILATHAETCFEEQAKLLLKQQEQESKSKGKGKVVANVEKVVNLERSPSDSPSPPPIPALRTSNSNNTSKFRPSNSIAPPQSKNAIASSSKSTSTSNTKASTATSTSNTNSRPNTTTLSRTLAAKAIQDAQIAADLGWSSPASKKNSTSSTNNSKFPGKGICLTSNSNSNRTANDDKEDDYFNDENDALLALPEEDWDFLEKKAAADKAKLVKGKGKGKEVPMNKAGRGGFEASTSQSKGASKKVIEIDDQEAQYEEMELDDNDEYEDEGFIEIDDEEEEDEDDDVILMGTSISRNSNKVNTERKRGPPNRLDSSPPKGSIYISTLPTAVRTGYAHMYTIKAPKAGKEAGIGPLAPQKMSAPYKKKTFRKGGWKRGASRKK